MSIGGKLKPNKELLDAELSDDVDDELLLLELEELKLDKLDMLEKLLKEDSDDIDEELDFELGYDGNELCDDELGEDTKELMDDVELFVLNDGRVVLELPTDLKEKGIVFIDGGV